jgi:hypothetical protein
MFLKNNLMLDNNKIFENNDYIASFITRRGALVAAFSLCFAWCAWSCAQAPELPYEEKLVIRGLLEAGQNAVDIQISRTIPPLDEFSYEKIFIGDAEARISVDGATYLLELQARTSTAANVPYRSLYRAPGLRIEPGKTYRIDVEWRGLRAWAETRVPLFPAVDSAAIRYAITPTVQNGAPALDTAFETFAFVRARASELLRVGTTIHDPSNGRQLSSRGYGDAIFITQDGFVSATSNIWRLPGAAAALLGGQAETRVNVEAYDGAFYRYYQTRTRSGQLGLFSPGGPNIEWNVQGDGIGEFAGVARIQRAARPQRR